MDEKISWCEDFLFNLEYILYIKEASILQIPVYYYLKTEGSLVAQSKSISKVVQTKLQIFEFYNEFYKSVYDEKEYSKKRLGVYKYLIDMAGDGMIMPRPFTNSSKLGEERVPVANLTISEKNYLTGHYRNSKLLERYYQTVGFKYDLTLNDIKVFAHLSQMQVMKNRKELADYAGIHISTANRSIQKLLRKHMVEIKKSKSYMEVVITEEGKPVIQELQQVFDDYDKVRFQGFSEDEVGKYLQFQKKIDQNLNRVLKQQS